MTYRIQTQMDPTIFRAYDIRGIVDTALTEDAVYTIGLALGTLIQQRGLKTINTARDGRLSGPTLHAALNAGLLDSGCDVIDRGMVPSPVLYYACQTTAANSGVVLTGSHNPANYNGLKMLIDGHTLSADEIQMLASLIATQSLQRQTAGTYQCSPLDQTYCDDIAERVHLSRPLKIVVDCGSGVTGVIAPHLFRQLGCEVIALYDEIDGHFPHHHPDPTDEKNLQCLKKAVAQHQADIGLAFDGDGDRLGVVTAQGECIFADRLMMLFAAEILARKPNASIVFDVKCTGQLSPWIRAHHGNPVMYKTGHSLIKRKMKAVNAELAGEMSGHIFFADRWYGFDDALYAGARLLEILCQAGDKRDDVFAQLPQTINTPELKIAMADERKFSFIDDFIMQANFGEATLNLLDGVRVEFSDGWGLLRASNTTPCLVLRFEADSAEAMARIQSDFKAQLLHLDPALGMSF